MSIYAHIILWGPTLDPHLLGLLQARWSVLVAQSLEEGVASAAAANPFAILTVLSHNRSENRETFARWRHACPQAQIFVIDTALDLNTMVHATNECHVKRFISLPIDAEALLRELTQASEQYDLMRRDFNDCRAGIREYNKRILCVDDEEDILNFYHDILSPPTDPTLSEVLARRQRRRNPQLEASHSVAPLHQSFPYEVTTATNGERAARLVREAVAAGRPFAAGFFDMKMPGGMDGLETIRAIRAVDPNMMCAVVTAYCDYSISTVQQAFEDQSSWIYFNKPFSEKELQQGAVHLVNAWNQRQRRESLKTYSARLRMLLQRARHDPHADPGQHLVERLCLHTARDILSVDGASLLLMDRDTGNMRLTAHHGCCPEDLVYRLASHAIRQNTAVILDGRNAEPLLFEHMSSAQLQSAVSIPLRTEFGTLGVFTAVYRNGESHFMMEDLELFRLMADPIAPALESLWRAATPSRTAFWSGGSAQLAAHASFGF